MRTDHARMQHNSAAFTQDFICREGRLSDSYEALIAGHRLESVDLCTRRRKPTDRSVI
jgi:hypothetical protein